MEIIDQILMEYEKDNYTDAVYDLFDMLKDSPRPTSFFGLLQMINENRSEKFSKESIKALMYHTVELQNPDNLRMTKDAIGAIINNQDNSDSLRIKAIQNLGVLGEWPDLTLRKIIEDDEPRELKVFAFSAILNELKLPRQVVDLETSLAIRGEIEPTFARINEITQARADGHFDHLITDAQQS